jgi:ATP-binding cassette subfamily F protein 3
MAGATDQRELLRIGHEHEAILHELELRGGYNYEYRIRRVLSGLGFAEDEFEKPVRVLSGGQRTRLAIGKVLLASGEVILLDEPTNHLDIEATEWLEAYLQEFSGAVLVASHDRWFLDAWATRIVEFERKRLFSYPGNFSAYERQRAERDLAHRRAYEKQQEYIEKQEAFIRRYHYGQRAREARGRAKRLGRLERIEAPEGVRRGPAVRFNADVRGGQIVVDVEHLAKRFGEQVLFTDVHFTATRGERIGIIGPNGAGKTTLLKIILGDVPADAGAVRIGHNIQIGYHDQDLAQLDDTQTVLGEMSRAAPHLLEQPLRDHLGRFGFRGEDKGKPVAGLSGGERTRLALAKLTLSGANLLILDEPTNHLDVYARQALAAALADYDGTVLFVTHDRRLLNDLATRIVRIEAGEAKVYYGNYDTYLHMRRKAERQAAKRKDAKRQAASPDRAAAKKKATKKTAAAKRARRKPKRGHRYERRRMNEIETEIDAHTDQVRQLEADLADPELYKDGERVRTVRREIEDLRARVGALEAEWAALAEKIEG